MSLSPDPSNSDTSSSRASSEPAHNTIINEGSLTLAEFVQRLETPGHHTVKYDVVGKCQSHRRNRWTGLPDVAMIWLKIWHTS
uniref:Ras-associating domain-containing protein n=1 Tax=Globodera pallida TaxID=36090 RepID=A0A183BUJ6_GLOPA